jgi:RadC-like JAB domain
LRGKVNNWAVSPSQLLVISNASRVTYPHYPSGNISPSEADQKITKNIKECGILLDMANLDHIIVLGERYYSLADEGAFLPLHQYILSNLIVEISDIWIFTINFKWDLSLITQRLN